LDFLGFKGFFYKNLKKNLKPSFITTPVSASPADADDLQINYNMLKLLSGTSLFLC